MGGGNNASSIFDDIENDTVFTSMEDMLNQPMPTIIKVVGVGGGGSNAINHMYEQQIHGVSFVVINTDRQALHTSPVPNRLLIGPQTTKGLGAGNKPEVAREAAIESADEINALFDDDTKMVFITAGMGGGTGTGAAPVVAKIARDRGILTIGIVTIPFLFEGKKKILKALDGADEMQKYVDALLVINNERLTEIFPDLDFDNAFGKADDTLSVAARSISELITTQGKINLDFNDVNTTLREGGVAVISSGYGEGENRVTKAIEDALNSPLLKNRDIYGSKNILVNIYYSQEATNPFKMDEVKEMSRFMNNFCPEVDVIWGVAYDDTLGDKVKITILAAGFEVSLEGESPEETETSNPVGVATAPSTTSKDGDRLAAAYGADNINAMTTDQAKARYVVLKPEELDNPDIIDQLEKSPTYNRDQKSKTQIQNIQTTSHPKTDEPAAEPKKSTGTISF